LKEHKEKNNPVKKIYNFYSSGLSYKDVEKLVKQDVPEVYEFYAKRMKQPESSKNKFSNKLLFIRNLFIEFLEQLTPIRRVLYSAAVVIFILSYFAGDWQWAVIAFFLVNLLIAFELADKLTAKSELDVARQIQTSLMPKSPPSNKFFEISCYGETAKEVGGDYYDFIEHPSEDKMFVVIGDISGKGMAAAIHMVQVQSILYYLTCGDSSPKNILIELNKNLLKILRKGSFFTANFASINPGGSITFCRAGHQPLIHFSKKENSSKNIVPKGIGLGLINSSMFNNSLEEKVIFPEKDDVLVFYTDGIVEARNIYKQEFSEEKLLKIVNDHAEKSADQIKEQILLHLSYFSQDAPTHDDFSLIVMKTK
jgi:phosphoserine phosphatase RsbU/P